MASSKIHSHYLSVAEIYFSSVFLKNSMEFLGAHAAVRAHFGHAVSNFRQEDIADSNHFPELSQSAAQFYGMPHGFECLTDGAAA